ncbi:hypothetical protein EJD97_010778 [Solanum chilense]|uniref:Retrotransposon gag domain-containing protein n=1 Tax=Solanum chilense TaxID=4083 RepID=A0A6N2BMA3_SOLCI|nr:hypothetical protein EJD97_010778 [Solanum chilense]
MEALTTLNRALTTHVKVGMEPRVNVVENTLTSRLKDFLRMNPPIFRGSKVGEDNQEFLDEVYKILYSIGVTSREKAKFDSYQVKDVVQVWYSQWKDNRPVESGSIEWDEFKEVFLGKYIPRDRIKV